MSAGTSTQSEILREWSPNHRIFEALAKEAGRFRSVSALTAVDADPDFLALANDLGHLYWYNRKTDSAIKLRVENSRSPICCVKIVSTVDYMVACGHKNGHVNVFQIPKPHPENLPDHVKPKANKQAQRFTISDLHKSRITSLEWSKNGTKLFSGDENGIVILTEFDYYMHICKSSEIVNESYEIVQLSYYPNYLLVSCDFRCIICDYQNGRWNVNQVGKLDRRNSLSKLGGTFHFNYDKPNDIHIYSARTGVKIWSSDFKGKVLKTLLFKDSIWKSTSQVLLLNPPANRKIFSLKDLELGPLYMFNEKYIVTHSSGVLFILDPETQTTFATVDQFRGIISIAVTKREIFVLESDNCIVRLSFVPEDLTSSTNENRMTKSLMNPIQLALNTIKDIANSETKLYFPGTDKNDQNTGNVHDSSIPTYTDITSVVKAEECFELPPIKDLTEEFDDSIVEQLISAINDTKNQMCDSIEVLGTSPRSLKPTTSIDKKHVFNTIGNIDYPSDIVHSSKTKKTIPTNAPIMTDPQPCSSKCDNKNNIPITTKGFHYDYNLFPVKKSPETLEKEVRDNEEKLAKFLNLEPVTLCPIKPSSSKDVDVSANTENSKKYIAHDDDDDGDTSNTNIKKNNARFEKGVKKNQTELTPKCVSIPNVWNLQEIKIDPNVPIAPNKVEKCTENSSVFDADWELV